MKNWMIAAALAAVPALALAQAAKDAAKGSQPVAPKASSSDVVAKVNGAPISQARLNFYARQQSQRGQPDNAQSRAQYREDLVNREIVAQEAQRLGLSKTPEVQVALELPRQEILVSAYLSDYLRKHPVSEEDLQKEYEAFKTQAVGEKEYRARHILVETEQQAKDLIAQLKRGAKFEELATKNSKDPGSKDRGGDLDWAVPNLFDRQFGAALTKLQKGQFTEEPVQTKFGYHIIRLDDVRAVPIPSYAELKQRIQQHVVQQRIEQGVKELRAKAKVE